MVTVCADAIGLCLRCANGNASGCADEFFVCVCHTVTLPALVVVVHTVVLTVRDPRRVDVSNSNGDGLRDAVTHRSGDAHCHAQPDVHGVPQSVANSQPVPNTLADRFAHDHVFGHSVNVVDPNVVHDADRHTRCNTQSLIVGTNGG